METGIEMYQGDLKKNYFRDTGGTDKSKVSCDTCVEKLERVY